VRGLVRALVGSVAFGCVTLLATAAGAGPQDAPTSLLSRVETLLASGDLACRLSEPEEALRLLGPPASRSSGKEGDFALLFYEYPGSKLVFGRREQGPAAFSSAFTLLDVAAGDEPWGRCRDARLRLRVLDDLDKLDTFDGVQGVSLARLDLRSQGERLRRLPFDSLTEWPTRERMPEGFDPERLLVDARGPGLGVGRLHAQGIDGRGVGLAIIDQPLLLGHQEYTGRLVRYDATGLSSMEPQMHASSVASIAAGRRVGVAPGVELSFFAVPMWEKDNRYYVAALERILELNRQLPEEQRIRAVSLSDGSFEEKDNLPSWRETLARAQRRGVFVATCDPEWLRFGILSRVLDRDPDEATGYTRGRYSRPGDVLLVPGAGRSLASHRGPDVFYFEPEGGLSWGAPYLAGLAALAYQVDRSLEPDVIRSILIETATPTEVGPVVSPERFIQRVRARAQR